MKGWKTLLITLVFVGGLVGLLVWSKNRDIEHTEAVQSTYTESSEMLEGYKKAVIASEKSAKEYGGFTAEQQEAKRQEWLNTHDRAGNYTGSNSSVSNKSTSGTVTKKSKVVQKYISDSDKDELWSMAKSTIKNNLKSPKSAEFSGEDIYIYRLDEFYYVSGKVTAQNSFGVELQNTFLVVFTRSGGKYIVDSWTII